MKKRRGGGGGVRGGVGKGNFTGTPPFGSTRRDEWTPSRGLKTKLSNRLVRRELVCRTFGIIVFFSPPPSTKRVRMCLN